MTHLLPQTLGHQRTMELIVLGERHGAQALKDLGMVNRVVPLPDMLPTALVLESEAAMACFADPDTAQRIADFAAGHLCAGGHRAQRLHQPVQISFRGVDGR